MRDDFKSHLFSLYDVYSFLCYLIFFKMHREILVNGANDVVLLRKAHPFSGCVVTVSSLNSANR